MKNKILLYLGLISKVCFSQTNLVPNPSFEQLSQCPYGWSQLNYANGWFTTDISNNSSTPDLYNTCNQTTFASVPQNYKGYQLAHSGNGYCGVISFIDFPPFMQVYVRQFREYIEVHLTDTLQRKSKYTVSFYVSLSDSSTLAVSKMGAYLSDTIVSFAQDSTLLFTPQVENPQGNYLTNKTNWVKIEGNYTAHGGEQYIIIGTYATLATIDTVAVPHVSSPYRQMAYYYIDDVSVTLADSTNAVNELGLKNRVKLYPNPAENELNCTIQSDLSFEGSLEIYDLLSKQIAKFKVINGENKFSLESIASGIYYYKIIQNQIIISQNKLIVTK